MSKRLPGLVIEVESLPEFLAKSDEDILQHVRSVLLHRAYAVQRAQPAKCDGVQFSPTKESCVFAAKGQGRKRGQAAPCEIVLLKTTESRDLRSALSK